MNPLLAFGRVSQSRSSCSGQRPGLDRQRFFFGLNNYHIGRLLFEPIPNQRLHHPIYEPFIPRIAAS
jgi:hypothetical protein